MTYPTRSTVNVLFTGAGRQAELLWAFKQAYQSLDLAGSIIVTDRDPLAPALQLADRPYLVPPPTDPEYMPALVEICRRERVDLVFALSDADLPVLARQRAVLEATGARLAVASPEAVAVTADKWLTVELFKSLELATPRSWLPGQLDPAHVDYPVFIKPRQGGPARPTFKVNNAAELDFFSRYVPQPLIQEYLPGPEITSDVICDLTGEVLAVVSHRRLEGRGGEMVKGITIADPALTAACVRVAEALPAVGPFTVQSILKDGGPHLTGLKARLREGVLLGIAAGVDSPAWLLARAAGRPVELPPLGHYQTGLFVSRFADSFFLTQADFERMAGQRL